MTDASDANLIEFDLTVPDEAGELALHCDIHLPDGQPRGTLLIAHGFLGYKDYGMFPYLATRAAMQGWGCIRFNFSHSGMTRAIERFERADLFERDTWNRQVEDLTCLVEAIRAGALPGIPATAPIVLMGHSRGGAASILFGGRGGDVQAVLAVASIDRSVPPSLAGADVRAAMDAEGHVIVRSARTGQDLRLGRCFLDAIEADLEGHDVLAMAERLGRRLTVVHGDSDPTVDVSSGHAIAEAAGVGPLIVPGGNHVFNVPNPFPVDARPSPQLEALAGHMEAVLAASGHDGSA